MNLPLPALRSTEPSRLQPAGWQQAEPVQLLDARIVALLRDGRLRTPAQVAAALRVTPLAVGDALTRLVSQRRVLKAGYAVPEPRQHHGYGMPWPTLWAVTRPRIG